MLPRIPLLIFFLIIVDQKWNLYKVGKLEVRQQFYCLKIIVLRCHKTGPQRILLFSCLIQIQLFLLMSALLATSGWPTKQRQEPSTTSPPAHPPHPIPAGRILWKAPTCLSEAIVLQKGMARIFSDHPGPFADSYLPSFSLNYVRSYFNNTPYAILLLVVLSPWLNPEW